jgi:hypothetical protein
MISSRGKRNLNLRLLERSANRSVDQKIGTPMPRCNNFQRDNFSSAAAFVSVLQSLHGRGSRLPSQPGARRDDDKRNRQRHP